MPEPKKETIWIVLASLAALGSAFYLQLEDSPVSASRPALLDSGYARRVAELLNRGEVASAQTELEGATLLTPAALELLDRMPKVSSFARTRELDTLIRQQLANAWITELGEDSKLDDAGRAHLALALSNAKTLLVLAPQDPNAHFAAGATYLRSGFESKAPIDFLKARSHLTRALQLDPSHPYAENLLRIAKARAAQR